ncbi:uncharacterized protein LOC130433361 [Triplophysa dalaica]|uniref:uncharacterized protein LOC130433361 n=1 Tax=Triplophysa dalaica TaxID=1582913 RepID=UPI0024DFD7B7|nr:uncharacterized protein LOC130433361 [Triplophysa dalaica]XP_056619162.1 uncharacterized protein LOC130433361 [Triplophysa dalaica]
MDSDISKINQSLTTAKDMRDQTKLMMQPYANWEEYLTPAPLSIAIMGELIFISSVTDFSINKNPPEGGYKYIRYPESFRACLMQVCNSGWTAFNEAHSSMDQIRLHTAQVPDYIMMAVKILYQDNDEVIEAHLPDQMNNIRVIADECLKLSTETEKHFMNVILIIQELLEACVNAEHVYGEEKEVVKKKIEENKLREKSAQEAKTRTEKAMNALEKELENTHENYQKAMNSLPEGWNMVGMDIVCEIAQSYSVLLNGLVSMAAHPVNACCIAKGFYDSTSHKRGQQTVEDVFDEINSCSKSAEILQCAQAIKEQMNVSSKNNEINWKKLYDQKEKTTQTDFSAEQFQRISNELEKINDCKGKSEAQVLCLKGINICNQLAKYAPEGKCVKDMNEKIIQEVLELINSARVFDSESKSITQSPAIYPKPPMMYKHENRSENTSLSHRATDNAQFAIEQSRAQLNKTRESYEKCMENLEKNEKELNEVLVAMRNCDLKQIDFKTTIEMLVKGMDAMGRVKEQWEKMVRFFQMVSNIVKTSLSTTLKNFVSAAEKTQALSYNAKLFSKDLLYTQAFKASDIASLVNMISGTYTEISNKYLMDRVSSLGKLMVMDKSKPEFQHERLKLRDSCDKAQKGILELVLKNKEEFERKSAARLERIDRELLAILPAAPPEEIKKMQEAVQAGFSEEEAESYY